MSATLLSRSDYNEIPQTLQDQWQALLIFSGYRLLLAMAFVFFIVNHSTVVAIGGRFPEVSSVLAWMFLGYAAVWAALVYLRQGEFRFLVIVAGVLDIVFIIAFIHLSINAVSTLGILINIIIAGTSLVLPGRLSLLFAALASILLLLQLFIDVPNPDQTFNDSLLLGLLGISFFATAITAHILSQRANRNAAVASQHRADLANLSRLNEHIVARMNSGIIVVGNDWQVYLMNDAAKQMFDVAAEQKVGHISEISKQLAERLRIWQADPRTQSAPLQTTIGAKTLVHFMPLAKSSEVATIIFIEDMALLAQQAQQMKLASLGRFTSSIAHELRNPLAAISHAGQLLQENIGLSEQQQRLVNIITEHSQRMNGVINNILQLSRRDKTLPQEILVEDWLHNFIKNFSQQYQDKAVFNVQIEPQNFTVLMDSSQLQQILINIVENGLHAGLQKNDKAVLTIRSGYELKSRQPYLEILDNGGGVDPVYIEKIFEPFFTTARNGTGLGLYIANELCQANQALLTYINYPKFGACFRITFAR